MFAVLFISSAFMTIYGQDLEIPTSPAWSYHGETAPCYWPSLYPEYCSYIHQSPINIDDAAAPIDPSLKSITFSGYDQELSNSILRNTGHTVEVIPSSKETYKISDGGLPNEYKLYSLNFHWGSKNDWGSEHAINGSLFPLELQLVHINEKYSSLEVALDHSDGLAVLTVFFKLANDPNPAITNVANILNNIRYADTKTSFNLGMSLDSILPTELDRQLFYRYNGSLTTPTCNEAIIWSVFAKPLTMTEEQLLKFRRVLETPSGTQELQMVDNYRPRQPVNDRKIFRSMYFQ